MATPISKKRKVNTAFPQLVKTINSRNIIQSFCNIFKLKIHPSTLYLHPSGNHNLIFRHTCPLLLSRLFQFVGDGVFKAELNEFLTRELSEDGYSGVEVRVTPTRTEIIIMATRTDRVLGEKNRRIRELTSVVQKRFNFPENSVVLYGEKVANRGLCAIAQAESLRFKLIGGLAVRRACYGVLRYIMECGAKGNTSVGVCKTLIGFFRV